MKAQCVNETRLSHITYGPSDPFLDPWPYYRSLTIRFKDFRLFRRGHAFKDVYIYHIGTRDRIDTASCEFHCMGGDTRRIKDELQVRPGRFYLPGYRISLSTHTATQNRDS